MQVKSPFELLPTDGKTFSLYHNEQRRKLILITQIEKLIFLAPEFKYVEAKEKNSAYSTYYLMSDIHEIREEL